MSKYRLLILLSLFVIIPVGFLTRFYTGPAQAWVSNSLGGFFYEIFWCLVFAFVFPKTQPYKIAVWVFFATCSLEFLQLWHPPFLEYLRGNFIGRTILGNSFNRCDFPYYVAGSLAGYIILATIQKFNKK